jgi:hypothetical protein
MDSSLALFFTKYIKQKDPVCQQISEKIFLERFFTKSKEVTMFANSIGIRSLLKLIEIGAV